MQIPPEVLERILRGQAMPDFGHPGAPSAAPDIAPPPEPQGAPPPPPSAPAASDVSPPPSQLEQLMAGYQRFVTDYSPDRLAAAQGRDRANIEGNRFAQNMNDATGLVINHPGIVKTAPPVPLEVQNFLARRELAKDQIGTQTQMMQMDPSGPIAKATIDALGLPPGTSPLVAKAIMDARKERAGLEHTGAETTNLGATTEKTRKEIPGIEAGARKSNAEATASEIENGPAAPAMLAMAKKLGVTLPPSTTNKQARETIDAEAKSQGLAVDWAKVGIEKRHLDVEEKHYRSDHPDEPVPGYVFAGPPGTAAPGRDSPEVQTLGEKVAASGEMKQTLKEMKEIYDRNGTAGRIAGPDATRLDQLHEKLLGTIGRAASGGKLAAYDITLAHEQLPRPSDIRGAIQTKNIHAAIDQLTKDADIGHREWAKAHNFAPKGGGNEGAATVVETRTTREGQKLEKLSDGTIREAK